MTPSPDFGDEAPYDRRLIRSGGVSGRSSRERLVRAPHATRRRSARAHANPRRPRGWRMAGTFLILALLAFVVGVTVLGLRAAAFNASVSSAPFPSTALLGPLNGSDRVNVLMVGYGGDGHHGAYLADSIQVISIDPAAETTTIIPIPRDLWIEGVGAYGQNGKVNQVFSAGHALGGVDAGGELLAEVVGEITGLQVNHWLSVDFAGFEEMVDAVGGVTVENPVAFRYTTNQGSHDAGKWNVGAFEAGSIHLDGAEALAYARVRYASVPRESNDFARSIRQGRIVGALRDQLGDGGIGSVVPGLRLMDAMEGRVRTDLSALDLFLLSSHLSGDRRLELTEGPVLVATTNTNGQYILVPAGWAGPGSYRSLRGYLSRELAADAP